MEYSRDREVTLPEIILNEFQDEGFFYKCRHLEFDYAQGGRFVQAISEMDASSLADNEKRSLALAIFDLPFLLAVWRERCIENGANDEEYSRVMGHIHRAVHEKMNDLLAGNNAP